MRQPQQGSADFRGVWATLAFVVLSLGMLAVALLAPLRPQGGDTVAGRLAMVTLACEGRSDLATVDWLYASAKQGKLPYYARVSDDQRSIVSSFGPGPGWLGWAFFQDIRPGSVIDDQLIRERARIAASAANAVSTFLLALGLLAVVEWRWALVGAATTSLSFAGAASLAQGLWQQTAALPFYTLGLTAALWCHRRPRLMVLAALSAIAGCWLRPPDALLALGIVLMAISRATIRELSRATVALTLIGVTVLSVAFGAWNLWYYGSFFPVAQWHSNELMTSQVFALDPQHVVNGLIGLVASPGRGILWFAPIVPLGIWLALRVRGAARLSAMVLVTAIAAQFVVCAVFHKWWGGIAFGPRLLAIAVWFAMPLAWVHGMPQPRWQRIGLIAAMSYTVAIGVTGLHFYDPRKWEIPNDVDHHPERLFWVRESHWARLLHPVPPIGRAIDAPEGPFRYCAPRGLRTQ